MARGARGRRVVEPRIRTFFGAEGDGEVSLARWLKDVRNASGRRHHHDVHKFGGGSILFLVEEALKKRKERDLVRPGRFVKSFLFLDEDRCAQDGATVQKAVRLAHDKKLTLVWQTPNLEGLLLRLFPRCETLVPAVADTRKKLKKKWPDYRKSFARQDLKDRFKLEDLRRAAKYDEHLRRLLSELDLIN